MFQYIKSKYGDQIIPGRTYKSCKTKDESQYVVIMERVEKKADDKNPFTINDDGTYNQSTQKIICSDDPMYPMWTITNESRESTDPMHAKFRGTVFKVLLIINKKTGETIDSIVSIAYSLPGTEYTVNQLVFPKSFRCKMRSICAPGIHFFNDFDTAFMYDYRCPEDFIGVWTEYDDDGKIAHETTYSNGLNNGKIEKKSFNWSNGHDCEISHRVNGILNGHYLRENSNHRQEGHYINDEKYGLWKIEDKALRIISEGCYVDNGKNGRWVEKYTEDNKYKSGCYLNGKKSGQWVTVNASTQQIFDKCMYDQDEQIDTPEKVTDTCTDNKVVAKNNFNDLLVLSLSMIGFVSFCIFA